MEVMEEMTIPSGMEAIGFLAVIYMFVMFLLAVCSAVYAAKVYYDLDGLYSRFIYSLNVIEDNEKERRVYLERLGNSLRNEIDEHFQEKAIEKDIALFDELNQKGISLKKLATISGVSRATIMKHLKEYRNRSKQKDS